jgi:hypothetical protein
MFLQSSIRIANVDFEMFVASYPSYLLSLTIRMYRIQKFTPPAEGPSSFICFNPDSAIGNVGQQKTSTILGAHGLFWIEGIASYFEIQNGSKCLRLKKNEVE